MGPVRVSARWAQFASRGVDGPSSLPVGSIWHTRAVPSLSQWAAFVAASIVLVAIPGPSLLFVLGRALSAGRREAILSVVGNASGVFVQASLVALGLGPIVAASAAAYNALKFAGAFYLVWLGISTIRHRRDAAAALGEVGRPQRRALHAWRDGFVVGSTNPKTVVFFVALLPQFVAPAAGHVWLQLLALGATFCVIAVLSDGLVAVLASGARDWFARSPRRMERMSATGGLMMIGLGVTLAATGRPE